VLYNFKTELKNRCHDSIVEIDYKKVGNKICFCKVFMAIKSYIIFGL
jgi:hypothetical protein